VADLCEVTNPAAWDAALLALPQPHILQSWAWGELKAQTGWTARRLVWAGANTHGRPARDEATEIAATNAAATLLVRRLHPRLPVAVAYIPKGPLLDWSVSRLVEDILGHIEAEARRQRAIFIKIDPDVRADTDAGQQVCATLARRGWRPSAEQIQYRNTVVNDLTPDEETLLAAMKPKWRYNIRLAERRGVVVRGSTADDLPAFYAMYAETGGRDGFLVRPYAYYRTIWARFLADDLGHLLLAEVEGRPVAGIFLFRFGPTAWYFYGASTDQSRELMPNHALQWAAMRWAKSVGCTRYDWWGAPGVLAESDPLWGVYRFKQGFGGEFTPGIGAWDYPISRAAYWAYTVAMPKVLAIMRGRHRPSGTEPLLHGGSIA